MLIDRENEIHEIRNKNNEMNEWNQSINRISNPISALPVDSILINLTYSPIRIFNAEKQIYWAVETHQNIYFGSHFTLINKLNEILHTWSRS